MGQAHTALFLLVEKLRLRKLWFSHDSEAPGVDSKIPESPARSGVCGLGPWAALESGVLFPKTEQWLLPWWVESMWL